MKNKIKNIIDEYISWIYGRIEFVPEYNIFLLMVALIALVDKEGSVYATE